MKILMIDRSGFQMQTRKVLLEDAILGSSVDMASTLTDVYIVYEKSKYDVVIIDPIIENGQACVDLILGIDPKQSIIVVSDVIKCVISRCSDCVEKHEIRRLFNPTPIHNIVRMVEGFRGYGCDHYDEETNKIKV
jgi:hypothetical protein